MQTYHRTVPVVQACNWSVSLRMPKNQLFLFTLYLVHFPIVLGISHRNDQFWRLKSAAVHCTTVPRRPWFSVPRPTRYSALRLISVHSAQPISPIIPGLPIGRAKCTESATVQCTEANFSRHNRSFQ